MIGVIYTVGDSLMKLAYNTCRITYCNFQTSGKYAETRVDKTFKFFFTKHGLSSYCQLKCQCQMSKQTDDVDQLRVELRGLEDQLKVAKENERLLVEYPDLHYVNNSPVSIAGILTSLFLSFDALVNAIECSQMLRIISWEPRSEAK